MKGIWCCIIIITTFPSICIANTHIQNDPATVGVDFVKLKWEEVLQKARLENKYIFVDCYATWCLPCKKMERDVFNKKEVGDFINANFISVRVQMDTSKSDDEYVKEWYRNAHDLKERFKVNAFPSYLFFSPDGKIVHRYLYTLSDTDFIKVSKSALSPEKQYYSLIESFKNGKLEHSKLGYLAIVSKQIGEERLANELSNDYVKKYLNKLSDTEILKKKHFEFFYTFPNVISSKDKVFEIMYKTGYAVDKLMNQEGFSKLNVQNVITREEINPSLLKAKNTTGNPEWDELESGIRKKFNNYYAGLVVLSAQLKWHLEKKDTSQIIKHRIKFIDKYGLDTVGMGWVYLNNFAWNYVFTYSSNRDTLNKVAGWMKIILQAHQDDCVSIDTYANLLFKAGRVKEAILWEEKAVLLEDEAAKKGEREPDSTFRMTLEKMREGLPTWLSNSN